MQFVIKVEKFQEPTCKQHVSILVFAFMKGQITDLLTLKNNKRERTERKKERKKR